MSKYLILIISFYLEGALTLLFSPNTLFLNLFTILGIYIVYPLFKDKKRNYFITSLIFGFLYDLVYMKEFGINLILFLLFAFLISIIRDNFEETFFSNILTSSLIIIVYRLFTYFIYIFFNNLSFDLNLLLKSIYSSLILNYIYVIILYILLKKKTSKL